METREGRPYPQYVGEHEVVDDCIIARELGENRKPLDCGAAEAILLRQIDRGEMVKDVLDKTE